MRIVVGEDERVGKWVCERAGGTWVQGRGVAIGQESDGKLVGGCLVEDWNGANCLMHVAGEGNWLTRSFLKFCFSYVFNQLGCKRATGIVPSVNEHALRFDRKLGFRDEAVLKDAHPEGDLIVLVMRRDECRWIR